jgi:hypothetical protein
MFVLGGSAGFSGTYAAGVGTGVIAVFVVAGALFVGIIGVLALPEWRDPAHPPAVGAAVILPIAIIGVLIALFIRR